MAERTCKNCGKRITCLETGTGNWTRWCSSECRTTALERTRQARMARRGPCRVAGCQTRARNASTDLCEKHYYEIRRRDAKGQHPKRPLRDVCRVEECSRLDIGMHRLCALHYASRPIAETSLSDTWWGGENVGYSTAHARVVVARGKVNTHGCVDCGDPAENWSYDYNDPNEATFKGAPYGVNPSYYSPRCIPCHAIFDSEMNIAIGKTDQRPKKTATR